VTVLTGARTRVWTYVWTRVLKMMTKNVYQVTPHVYIRTNTKYEK